MQSSQPLPEQSHDVSLIVWLRRECKVPFAHAVWRSRIVVNHIEPKGLWEVLIRMFFVRTTTTVFKQGTAHLSTS